MSPLIIGLLGSAVVGLLVRRRRRRAVARRQEALEGALPFTVDLIAVVLGSGGTIRQAVEAVAIDGPEPTRATFAAVLEGTLRGRSLADGLAEASAQLGPTFHSLFGALMAAEADGAPMGIVLVRLADDVEQRDRWQAEAAAGRLSVSLLPPLVVCLLPAVLVGAVVPLAIVALRHLGG